MKKSILSIAGMLMLGLLVYSCMKAENAQLPNEDVNLKGEIKNEQREANQTGTYDTARLLTYLHGYIKAEAHEGFTAFDQMPERKEAAWFFENFKTHFNPEIEAENWALEQIEAGEILVFGITVHDVQVTALIFSEGLQVHERFGDSSGFFFDTRKRDCDDLFVPYGFKPGEGCSCHWVLSCHRGGCLPCPEKGTDLDLEKLFDVDRWIIDERVFGEFGPVPVGQIQIGDPVLQLQRRS